jgi:hypothetical protein
MLHTNIEKNCVFGKISGVQSVTFKRSFKCYMIYAENRLIREKK